MKYAKLSELSDEALVHRELRLERELVDATFRLRTGQLDDTSVLGKIRKDIARARTAQREREVAAGLGPNALRDKFRSSFDPSQASAEATETSSGGAGFLQGIADRLGLGGGEASAAE